MMVMKVKVMGVTKVMVMVMNVMGMEVYHDGFVLMT